MSSELQVPVVAKKPRLDPQQQQQQLEDLPVENVYDKQKLNSLKQQLMENPKVVEMILHGLGLKNLKSTRLVNKIFNEKSREIMRGRRNVEFKLEYSTQDLPQDNQTYYTNLITTMENCTLFPTCNFNITGREDLGQPEPQKILSLCGPHVKNLELNLVYWGSLLNWRGTPTADFTTMETFRDILINKCPNMEHLTLGNLPNTFDWMGSVLFPDPEFRRQSLPNLKSLRINYRILDDDYDDERIAFHQKIIGELVLAAGNLKDFEMLPAELAVVPVQTKKMFAVNSLMLLDFPYRSLQGLVKLVGAGLKIRDLCILGDSKIFEKDQQNLRNESATVLTKILTSSQATLTKLKITPRLLTSHNFPVVIPTLYNLRELVMWKVDNWSTRNGMKMPEFAKLFGLRPSSSKYVSAMRVIRNVNKMFPNVQSVLVHVKEKEEHPFWDSDDYTIGKQKIKMMPSVTTLEVKWYRTSCMLEKLSWFFPNVTKLVLFMDSHSESSDAFLKYWPRLQLVKIHRCGHEEPLDWDPVQEIVSIPNYLDGQMVTILKSTHSSYKNPVLDKSSDSSDSRSDSESDLDTTSKSDSQSGNTDANADADDELSQESVKEDLFDIDQKLLDGCSI